MPTLPTVRVVSPVSPGGYIVINASDLRDDHEIWEDVEREPDTDDGSSASALFPHTSPHLEGRVVQNQIINEQGSEALPLQIVRGPRGRFFVKRGPMSFHGGNVFQSQGFDTREEAQAELAVMMRSEARS